MFFFIITTATILMMAIFSTFSTSTTGAAVVAAAPTNCIKNPLYQEIFLKLKDTFPTFNYKMMDIPAPLPTNMNIESLIKGTIIEYKTLYRRNPPRNYDRWIEFAYRKGSIIAPSHYEQIHRDFLPFRGRRKISKKQEEMILKSSKNIYKITKTERKTYASYLEKEWKSVIKEGRKVLPKKFSFLVNMLNVPIVMDIEPSPSSSSSSFNDDVIPLIMSSHDLRKVKCIKENYSNIQHSFLDGSPPQFMTILKQSVPILSNCKLSTCFNDILVPIYELLPTENAIPQGDHHSYEKNDGVSLLDFGFSNNFANKQRAFEDFKTKNSSKNRLAYVVDGHAWTSRVPFAMSYGFCTIYQSIFISWISRMLRPFIDYVPLPHLLDDANYLEKVLLHLGDNGAEVEAISKRGMERIPRIARRDDKISYILLVLLEYASLLDDDMVVW